METKAVAIIQVRKGGSLARAIAGAWVREGKELGERLYRMVLQP